MSLRALFRALVSSYFHHEKGRTALTMLGVALGVAVLVAIDLANESAISSFKSTVDQVAGRAELTVRGNGIGIPGPALTDISRTPGVRSASPLISGNAFYSPATDQASTQTLLLLGVDLLRASEFEDDPVRDIRFRLAEGVGITDYLGSTRYVTLTERFARRFGLAPGNPIDLTIGGTPQRLVIGALIDAGPFTDTLDGNVAVMDLAAADVLLRRGGLLDRVDLVLEPKAAVEEVAPALDARLPDSLLVERPEARGSRVDQMLAAFRFNLRALGHISILVGAFIIFNTMSVAVVRRRPAIGTLRAMGISRGRIRLVFLLEGALLGLVGSLIGVILGVAMAGGMVGQVSDAISINFVQTQASGVAVRPEVLLVAVLLGVGGSVLAAWIPANEAASTPPANTMRRGTGEGKRRPLWAFLAGGAALAVVGLVLMLREPARGLPIQGYAASVFFIGAFVLWSRPLLAGLTAALRRPYARLFGAEGLLAASSIQSTLGRSTIAICGLMIGLGMAVSVSVMISSFRTTVVGWMEQVLVADLYIQPQAPDGARRPEPMPTALADRIRNLPGIDAIDPFRTRRIVVGGEEAWLGAGELDVVRFTNQTLEGRPTQEVMRQAAARDELVVSEALARKHGFQAGDPFPVPTPGGIVEIPIAGIYFDYSSEQGYAIMDRQLYQRYFPADDQIDSIAIFLREGADRRALRDRIQEIARATPGIPALSIRANDDLRTFALQAFDRTFSITYVLQLIAIIVSILGVATTLLSQLLDRRHEIVTLRYLGATHRRVARVVVLETALIGIAGTSLGVVAGILLSYILTRVIMLQSFGWTIAYAVPWLLVVQIAAVVFASTLLAAVLPAREAMRFSNRAAQTMAG